MKYYYLNAFLIILLFLIYTPIYSQEIYFDDNEVPQGFKMLSSDMDRKTFSFSVQKFSLTPVMVEGDTMSFLNFGLSFIPGEEGKPELPSITKNILIPDDSDIELHIISSEKEVFENIKIAPAAEIPIETEQMNPPKKGIQYTINELYPSEILHLNKTEIRGMQIANIGLSPFQYNPVTKQLIVYKKIEFELIIKNSKGTYGEERFRSPFWDQILFDLVYNAKDIPKIDYLSRNAQEKEMGCDYLIIVPNNPIFKSWADTIRRFRNEQGIHTKILTTEEMGGNSVEEINASIEEIYNTWDPVPTAILLLADYGDDENSIITKKMPHPWDYQFATDNYYADATQNHLPDFVISRITAANEEELDIMIHKFINYELSPPIQVSFYNEPVTLAGWDINRWFQICTATLDGFMENSLGKTSVRINAVYEGNPATDPWSNASNVGPIIDYFGPNGLQYFPESPSDVGGWTGGSTQDIVNAFNAGSFLIFQRDHGTIFDWWVPYFNIEDIDELNNADLLPHVFSIDCSNGEFDSTAECFAEKIHRKSEGGALSITALSGGSWSFYNDTQVWGMIDNMWPDFMPDYGGNIIESRGFLPAFANASGKYFLSASDWINESKKIITQQLFHHFGDAFGVVYTEIPQINTVIYNVALPVDQQYIDVQAEPYSLIGLSVDGEYIAKGICDEDGLVSIEIPQQLPATIIDLVASKQNFFRYKGQIQIIPIEGPYVTFQNYSINENNGVIEYNEEITMDFLLKNLGLDIAENIEINLTTDDEYIDITDGYEFIGDMDAGQEVNINQVFTFKTATNIPDKHYFTLLFTATDGNSFWEREIVLRAHSPILEYSIIRFQEVEGNGNDYIDPGEIHTATIELSNNGSADFPEGNCAINSNSNYISIGDNSFDFSAIEANQSLIIQFEITCSAMSPPIYLASINSQITAGIFDLEHDYYFNIGLIVEDWESEGFSTFNWINDEDADWVITSDYVSEGLFSASSPILEANERSSLILNYHIIQDNEISFSLQISSQEHKDKLTFYIDDIPQESWSGLILFKQFTLAVPAGTHELKWEYAKDATIDVGMDKVWLDFIIMPPGESVVNTFENNKVLKTTGFAIYPNPNNGTMQLMVFDIKEPQQLKIYNATGQLVFIKALELMEPQTTLNVSHLPRGFYTIQIEDKSGTIFSQKLILK